LEYVNGGEGKIYCQGMYKKKKRKTKEIKRKVKNLNETDQRQKEVRD